MSLSSVNAGRFVEIVAIDAGCELENYFAALGILPGERIEVLASSKNGAFVVCVKNSKLVLGRGMAQKILVR